MASMPKAIAVVDYLGLRKDGESYKEFKIGTQIRGPPAMLPALCSSSTV
jgi:hypothetical protein